MKHIFFLFSISCAVLSGGCGQPPSAGGPPSDFPVQAVLAAVEPEPLIESIMLVGTIRSINDVTLVSEINTTVESIEFEEGDHAETDQVLIRLRDHLLRANLNEAEARLRLARANQERGEALLKTSVISSADFDQMKADFEIAEAVVERVKEELSDALVRAPLDGVVGERLVSVGEYVSVGTPLTSVVQLDPLEAVFHVPERFMSTLHPGADVDVTTTVWPDQVFEGLVSFIAPRVDEMTRTVMIKARIPNPDGLLKSGMFANMRLTLRARDDALIVPETAIRRRGEEATVYVMDEEGRAALRTVTTGIRMPGRVEITSGLTAGDRVVVEGHQKMGPGSVLIISPESVRYGVEPPEKPTDS